MDDMRNPCKVRIPLEATSQALKNFDNLWRGPSVIPLVSNMVNDAFNHSDDDSMSPAEFLNIRIEFKRRQTEFDQLLVEFRLNFKELLSIRDELPKAFSLKKKSLLISRAKLNKRQDKLKELGAKFWSDMKRINLILFPDRERARALAEKVLPKDE